MLFQVVAIQPSESLPSAGSKLMERDYDLVAPPAKLDPMPIRKGCA
jgi:hypothetical protein